MRKSLPKELSVRELWGSADPYYIYFSRLPRLETPHLLLRPFRMRDAGDVFAYASDEEVARFVLWDPHRNISDTRASIRGIRKLYRQGRPSSWAIELTAEKKVIGSIGFMWVSPENRSAEIGYSLSRHYWNRGIMTEALSRVLRSAFEDLPLHRIEAQHDIRNPASGRVMEKCGMEKEGLLRDRIRNKKDFVTVALWSIINPDDEGIRR